MRAVSIGLHNFRTFADAEIDLSPYALLVGANNCGKSNVIDAIRAFYEKGIKYEEGRDFPKFPTSDQESWVEIQFRPSDDESALLKEEYRLPDGAFRVRKYFKSSELDSDSKPKTGIYAYVGGQLSESRFYGAKNVQQGKLGEVIYIPAVSKLDEHTKLTGPSALRDLINTVLQRIIDASPSYDKLRIAFEEFEGGLKSEETPNGRSLTSLESEITSEISDWDTSFEFFVNPVAPDLLVKNLIGHRLHDHKLGQSQDPSCCGQGFQRHLIFTLIKLAARHSSGTESSARKDFSPRLTWILFEEPEAFLHPCQIDTLNASLRTVSQDPGSQVLISTHNPQFVSRNIEDIPSLIRLCRTAPQSTAKQVDSQTLTSILTANQEDLANWQAAGVGIHPDDLQADMECIKYALWLNPLRCSAFFANKVLLVEGPTETALFGHMLDTGQITNPSGGLFILDCMGKWNMHRFMNLLGALGIPHAVLYDYDSGKQGDVEIEKTIQTSRNPYTINVDHFPQDIEAFLGVAPAGRPHRKPQNIMWHLQQGKIDNSKLASVAEKVERALGI